MGSAVKHVKTGVAKATPQRKRTSYPFDIARPHEVVWQAISELFDAGRRFENPSFVYVIGEQDDGPLKIGVAKNPISRVRAMQTGNPRRLRIEQLLLGDSELEKLLHQLWEPHAIRSATAKPTSAPGTEWFEPAIRDQLLPIVATAAGEQVALVLSTSGELRHRSLEKIVMGAHAAHGFKFEGREEARLLAAGAGYVRMGRRSHL